MKYLAIYNALKEDIRAGVYAPHTQLPFITRIASVFKVAKSTAERAISLLQKEGLAEGIPSQGVFVREAGGPVVRTRTGRAKRIALLTMRKYFALGMTTPYLPQIVTGIEEPLIDRGIDLDIIKCHGKSIHDIRGRINALAADAIITLEFESEKLRSGIEACGIPVVHVDTGDVAGKGRRVLPNSFQGGDLAVHVLAKKDHTRLLFLHGRQPSEPQIEKVDHVRLQGIQAAVRALKGCTLDLACVSLRYAGHEKRVRAALAKHSGCTGIIVAGGMLLTALKKIYEVSPPELQSDVVAFELSDKPLTINGRPVFFCKWDGEAMGNKAVEVLLRKKKDPRVYYMPMYCSANQ